MIHVMRVTASATRAMAHGTVVNYRWRPGENGRRLERRRGSQQERYGELRCLCIVLTQTCLPTFQSADRHEPYQAFQNARVPPCHPCRLRHDMA